MCEPISAMTVATKVMIGLSVASAAVSQYSAYQSGKAQTRAINQQNEIRAQEIADAAGVEMTERARAARRERAMMRTRGSEAGINLGSGSFIDALQSSVMNQYNDQGLILRNESVQQRGREAEARSALARIQVPTALSAALAIGGAAASGYAAGTSIDNAGRAAAT
jgi:hypothetical protein